MEAIIEYSSYQGSHLETVKNGDGGCALCEAPRETSLHLLAECSFIRAVAFASSWGLIWDKEHYSSIENLVSCCLCRDGNAFSSGLGQREATAVLTSLLEAVWEARNTKVHEGRVDILETVLKLELKVEDILSLRKEIKEKRIPSMTYWTQPDKGWIAVNTDASTKDRRNAIAMVARDENGIIIHLATNQLIGLDAEMAELKALEWVTSIGEEQGWEKVICRCDAKRLVDII